jgi:hypothetical protein
LVKEQPMLQLNHSQAINTNAVYPDVEATPGITQVLLDFTQSINKNVTSNVIGTLANVVDLSNPWLVIQLTGSLVPTASGQYDVNIFEFTQLPGLGVWGQISQSFGSIQDTWGGNGGGIVIGNKLSTERAFISGSNEYSITQYLLPTNAGFYFTYNHP